MAAPPPSLDECVESMKYYLEHYIEKARGPGPLPKYLIICAGHPSEKVLVSIVEKRQFEELNAQNDQLVRDDQYEVEMYWIAKSKKEKALKAGPPPEGENRKARKLREREEKMTEAILKHNILSKPKPKQMIDFNGVKYEVIMKDSPVDQECWCNEEKFRSLFKVSGTRGQAVLDDKGKVVGAKVVPNVIAKDDVLFFELTKGESEDPEVAEEKKRKEARKAKKDRQKAKKEAAKAVEEVEKMPEPVAAQLVEEKEAAERKRADSVIVEGTAKEPETASYSAVVQRMV